MIDRRAAGWGALMVGLAALGCGKASSSSESTAAGATASARGSTTAATGLITGGGSGSSAAGAGGLGATGSAGTSSGNAAAAAGSSTGSTGTPGPDGSPCSRNSDCTSEICEAVIQGSSQGICVLACSQQSDCTNDTGTFCEPQRPGAANGFCVPASASHCLSCTKNRDCGWLSELCIELAGDGSPACHIDCSLAGSAACPSDYQCQGEDVGDGGMAMLCVPSSGGCSDAQGGDCTHLTTPQSCSRSNDAGSCTGQRICDPDAGRFLPCDAPEPTCLTSCDAGAPDGCTEILCTDVAEHCGTCGNCPGNAYNGINANAGCDATLQCTFSCEGENYDVNGDPSDGCEKVDNPLGNHTQNTAINIAPNGGLPCDDSSSMYNEMGVIPSDGRTHENPSVAGFDASSGSAPDWFTVLATGGTFCEDDVHLSLQIYDSMDPTCYGANVTTSSGKSYNCTTDSSGACSIAEGSGSYSDGDTLYFEIVKTCPASMTEYVSYNINGHL